MHIFIHIRIACSVRSLPAHQPNEIIELYAQGFRMISDQPEQSAVGTGGQIGHDCGHKQQTNLN